LSGTRFIELISEFGRYWHRGPFHPDFDGPKIDPMRTKSVFEETYFVMNQNLEDIARLAGVSRSTVSRVINNHPNVSAQTRQRVQAVIQAQHFRPNLAARALVTQHTHVLSLVIPLDIADTFTDPFFPTLIRGVTTTANQYDYAVMLWVGDSAEEEERFYQRILNNSLCDGIVITQSFNTDPMIPRLQSAGYPFVVVGPPQVDHLNYIDVDNLRAAQVAVAHLIRLGYERIGTITGRLTLGASQDRLQGYKQALERAGRPIQNDLIVEGQFNEISGYTGMKTLLQRGVDAVFAASDMMALGAMRAVHEQGLRIPDDIAVVGFDDMPVAATSSPPLTTVRQPIRDMGGLAAQALIDLLNGRLEEPYQLVLPAPLIVRESCGATYL
jgi:LacI family transcriptional regulator